MVCLLEEGGVATHRRSAMQGPQRRGRAFAAQAAAAGASLLGLWVVFTDNPRVGPDPPRRAATPASVRRFPCRTRAGSSIQASMSDSSPKNTAGAPSVDASKLELLPAEVEWKTCMRCGQGAQVVPSPTLACTQCGRIFTKMEEAWQKGR
jgi:hypothetical protein